MGKGKGATRLASFSLFPICLYFQSSRCFVAYAYQHCGIGNGFYVMAGGSALSCCQWQLYSLSLIADCYNRIGRLPHKFLWQLAAACGGAGLTPALQVLSVCAHPMDSAWWVISDLSKLRRAFAVAWVSIKVKRRLGKGSLFGRLFPRLKRHHRYTGAKVWGQDVEFNAAVHKTSARIRTSL